MEENQNETVVAKKSDEGQKVRFVIISEGQGGARIGSMLASMLPNKPFQIAINTSTTDFKQIDLPDNQKFKIGGRNADGAGKNRKLAKSYYKNFSTANIYGNENLDALSLFIAYYEEVLFHPTDQVIIINVFSSDGGTGSGIGPAFTATLANYINSAKEFKFDNKVYQIDDTLHEVPRPVVVGLVPRCRIDAGSTNLQNNIECFLDIQKWVDMGICNFFIADNNLPDDVKYTNTDEMYNIVNARIVAPWVKFFGVEMNSSIKCMDLQDKINVLRIPGCSSFTTITKDNQFNYVMPRGQSVARSVLMLRHDSDLTSEENAVKNMMNSIDVMSLDTTSAFFNLNEAELKVESIAKDLISASMVGFFGYKSINAIVEDLRDNERRLKVATQKKHAVMQENSNGFSTVEKDAEDLDNTFNAKVANHQDLMNMI